MSNDVTDKVITQAAINAGLEFLEKCATNEHYDYSKLPADLALKTHYRKTTEELEGEDGFSQSGLPEYSTRTVNKTRDANIKLEYLPIHKSVRTALQQLIDKDKLTAFQKRLNTLPESISITDTETIAKVRTLETEVMRAGYKDLKTIKEYQPQSQQEIAHSVLGPIQSEVTTEPISALIGHRDAQKYLNTKALTQTQRQSARTQVTQTVNTALQGEEVPPEFQKISAFVIAFNNIANVRDANKDAGLDNDAINQAVETVAQNVTPDLVQEIERHHFIA